MTLLRLTTCALAAVALMGATFSAADEASAQEKKFISIGTGGPTGVYFVVGNSVCRMVHKEAAEGPQVGPQAWHPLRSSVDRRLDLQHRPDLPGRARLWRRPVRLAVPCGQRQLRKGHELPRPARGLLRARRALPPDRRRRLGKSAPSPIPRARG